MKRPHQCGGRGLVAATSCVTMPHAHGLQHGVENGAGTGQIKHMDTLLGAFFARNLPSVPWEPRLTVPRGTGSLPRVTGGHSAILCALPSSSPQEARQHFIQEGKMGTELRAGARAPFHCVFTGNRHRTRKNRLGLNDNALVSWLQLSSAIKSHQSCSLRLI